MIRALVFDFDGLILDTEAPDFAIWREVYADHGCELSLDLWAQGIGTRAGVFDAAAQLEVQLGRPLDRHGLKKAQRLRFYTALERERLRPGIETYLREAADLGLRTAVASSATRDWVVSHLARFDVLDLFDVVRCIDDVPRPKPHPDLYLAAVKALAVAPEEAVAFEDSPNGITAAKRAGLHCVAVPNAVTRLLVLDEADLVVESLAEWPLSSLLERLESTAR